jgi:hypothetical protein
MFIEPIAPLIPKQELDIELSLDRLIDNLSRIDVLRTEEAHVLLDRFRSDIKNSNSVELSKNIRKDLPRRKEDLDRFLISVRESTRKSIVRTIALYDWASKIDEYLSQITSSEKDIKEKVLSLIKEISLANRNTAVTDSRIVSFNFRKKDDIEKTNGYNSITSGSVTNNISSQVVQAKCNLKFSRSLFLKNIYTNYSEEVSDSSEIGEKKYDTNQDDLNVVLSIKNDIPFNVADFGLDIPFEIVKVYSVDSSNRKEDITELVIGNNIQVNSVLAIETTKDSSLDVTSTHSYSLIFPKPVTNINVEIRIVSFDTYPLKMYNLINSAGTIIKEFNLFDSMIIDRRLIGATYSERKLAIDKEIATGIVKEISRPSSLRTITFSKCNVYTILSKNPSITLVKAYQSDLKIRRVEIYVDSYDPLQLIRFSILSGENEKQPISPINSNPVSPTRITYEDTLPKEIQLEITIPVVDSYIPILHGVSIVIGEVNL